jgi:hypothetical protein
MLQRFFITAILVLIFHSQILPNNYEPDTIELKIISHTFNEEFEQARQLCLDQIKLNPNIPKYYYYLINEKVIEYYQKVRELKPQNRVEGRKILNKEIMDYCESVIDKFDISKLDLRNKFYLGMIHGYLARIYGVDGSWWSAFKSGKKSRTIMDEIIKNDPQFYDAYLALGMIYYYADRMSGITSFIAGILGLPGDREKGLNYLQQAYQKGKLTIGQTALTLIEVYSSLEGNDPASIPYYEAFLKQYPRNKRTLSSYINTLMNIWDFKKAEELIKNDKLNLIDDLNKARFYDLKGEKESAVRFAEKALQNQSILYRGGDNSARYIIVLNSWLLGDQNRLKKYEPLLNADSKERFTLIRNNERTGRWLHDLSAGIASDKPINEIEMYLKSKPDFSNQKTFESQYNLLTGTFYFKSNQYDKSETFFYTAFESGSEREKYTSAKYLIEIYMKQNRDKKKVEKLLDIIDDLDNDQLDYRSKDLEKKYNL